MTAETLRRAAALMRERAEAATVGPWVSRQEHGRDYTDEGWSCVLVTSVSAIENPDVATTAFPGDDHENAEADAAHIASWHPAVALAVADWLDATAAEHESDSGNPTVDGFFQSLDTAPDIAALAVARAYLGESA